MKLTRFGTRIIRRVLNHSQIQLAKERVERRFSNLAQMPPVRIAVAGAGRFAARHLEVLSAIPNVELVGISNRGNSDLSRMTEQFGVKATFSDYRTMLDVTRPDAVLIVVSHFETVSVATECLNRGIPSLIEKPAGFVSQETERLAQLAAKRGCLNMVGVNRRYLSTVHEALTRILHHGPLVGICVEAPEKIGGFRSRGEHNPRLYERWLVANTIHAIDMLRCVGGDVISFSGLKDCHIERTGDSFIAAIRFAKGGLGTFVSHWLSVPGWSLTLYGDNVKAVLSLDTRGEFIFSDGGREAVAVDPIDHRFKPGLFAQDEAFISAVALGERLRYPASDLTDSVGTMRLIEAIAGAQ